MTPTRQFLVPVLMTLAFLCLLVGQSYPGGFWMFMIVTMFVVIWLAALESWLRQRQVEARVSRKEDRPMP